MIRRPPRSTLFPTRRSSDLNDLLALRLGVRILERDELGLLRLRRHHLFRFRLRRPGSHRRSEEHTSELQSLTNLVCRLLLEKKKKKNSIKYNSTLLRSVNTS